MSGSTVKTAPCPTCGQRREVPDPRPPAPFEHAWREAGPHFFLLPKEGLLMRCDATKRLGWMNLDRTVTPLVCAVVGCTRPATDVRPTVDPGRVEFLCSAHGVVGS